MDSSAALPSPPLSRVVVSGGTHGNELAGVCLVKEWLRGDSAPCLERSSFTAQPLLANPRATEQGVRYVNRDLNRCFKTHTLSAPPSPSDPYELVRARELDSLLGPNGSEEAVDFICDLHNTTANMGASLITAPDSLSMHTARYIQSVSTEPCRVISIRPEIPSFSLMSIAKHSITLEVGPQSTGLIRADIYNLMRRLVGHVLDFIDLFNRGQYFPASSLQCFEIQESFDYPRDEEGILTACIHPDIQDRDFEPLFSGDPLFQTLDFGVTVPYGGSEEPLYPVFINEAAYYSKGIAFWGAREVTVQLPAIGVPP